GSKWEKCRSRADGFGKLRDCVRSAAEQARAARSQVSSDVVSTGACGGVIERSIRRRLEGTVVYLDDIDRWLTVNQAQLDGPMKAKSFDDACRGELCATRPNGGWPQYAPEDQHALEGSSCTQKLVVCGSPAADCSPDEIARRLGVACDPKDNIVSVA